jgi:7 transmembrane receptor (rhodopsin family)
MTMISTRSIRSDITSLVLPAVESIVYKRDINYLYRNDSESDYENYTYATYGNNQFSVRNETDRNNSNSLHDDKVEYVDNYWALLAIILVFGTAAGNILVCLAIAWEKRLQNVTNYFLASLAITDLMVAVLVMPLGIVTLFRGKVDTSSSSGCEELLIGCYDEKLSAFVRNFPLASFSVRCCRSPPLLSIPVKRTERGSFAINNYFKSFAYKPTFPPSP